MHSCGTDENCSKFLEFGHGRWHRLPKWRVPENNYSLIVDFWSIHRLNHIDCDIPSHLHLYPGLRDV